MVFAGRGDEPMTIDVHDLACRTADAPRTHPRRRRLLHALGARAGRHRLRAAAEPLRHRHRRRDRQLLRRWTARVAGAARSRASPVVRSHGTGTSFADTQAHYASVGLAPPVTLRDDGRGRRQRERIYQCLNCSECRTSVCRRTGSAPVRVRASNSPSGIASRADFPTSWAGATASWPNRTEPGGTRGLDDYFTRDYARNIGAEIMGRNKFGPRARSVGEPRLERLVGRHPAVPHPRVRAHPSCPALVHVGRHHVPLPRRLTREALATREGAADGKDVRLGGGVATIREFLEADLVDTMHVAVAPFELGRGERLWTAPRSCSTVSTWTPCRAPAA